MDTPQIIPISEHDGIGVDVGLKEFAVCSHHEIFLNINKTPKIKKLEKQLKRQQRKLSRSYEQNKNRKVGETCYKSLWSVTQTAVASKWRGGTRRSKKSSSIVK